MKKQKRTVPQLFGLALAPLYLAIAQVESQCGKTSDNIYQIRDVYIRDVNRIVAGRGATGHFSTGAKFMRDASENLMRIYWEHWGRHYQEKTGMPVSYEVLARIHNGGPLGWKKPETVAYWRKVQNEIFLMEVGDAESWMGLPFLGGPRK